MDGALPRSTRVSTLSFLKRITDVLCSDFMSKHFLPSGVVTIDEAVCVDTLTQVKQYFTMTQCLCFPQQLPT